MKHIVVFGGSFDPVHNGHLKIVEAVHQQVKPDQFLLIPCGNPPHRDPLIATPSQRLQMLDLACVELPYVDIDTRELDSQDFSFSYLTLAGIQKENPDALLLFAMGWDSLVSLASWRNWREMLQGVCVLVVGRAGDRRELPTEIGVEVENWRCAKPEAGRIIRLDFEETSLSSTEVRDALKRGLPVQSYLLPSVDRYILQQNIYRDN